MQDILKSLTDKTRSVVNVDYLNKNIKPLVEENNGFLRPLPTLSPGGCTVAVGKMPDSLENPALVSFEMQKVHPYNTCYRVAFNIEDAAKAAEDNVYFNTVVVPILNEAINRYKQTFGDENIIRYGESFLKLSDFMDINGEYVEVRLMGKWASDKVMEK